MSSTERALALNSILMLTALLMMPVMCALGRQLASLDYIWHAKLQWSPSSSSWLISLLLKLKLRPGMTLCFLSKKMAQKELEKKNTHLTAATAGVVGVTPHHLKAQLALRWMHGTVSTMVCDRCSFSCWSLMNASIKREYVLLWIFLTAIRKM
jgi:hypothetical protein